MNLLGYPVKETEFEFDTTLPIVFDTLDRYVVPWYSIKKQGNLINFFTHDEDIPFYSIEADIVESIEISDDYETINIKTKQE